LIIINAVVVDDEFDDFESVGVCRPFAEGKGERLTSVKLFNDGR